MKDILILGMPRTGKTTLAGKLRKELANYDLISCDCIRNMLSNCFPQLGIGPDKSFKRSDNRILKELKHNVVTDKMIQEKCKIYGYPYIDTTENREATIDELMKKILKK